MKLPFLFKEDGFGNNNCDSYLWIVAILFLLPECSPPDAVAFQLLGSPWHNHFQLLLAPQSSIFPFFTLSFFPSHFKDHPHHQSCFSSLPHRFLSGILFCHLPYRECFLGAVFRVLCSSPKRHLTVRFRHSHEHLLSPWDFTND